MNRLPYILLHEWITTLKLDQPPKENHSLGEARRVTLCGSPFMAMKTTPLNQHWVNVSCLLEIRAQVI